MTYGKFYKKYRNKLTSLLRQAKNKYYKNKFHQNNGNPKSQWRTINTLLGRSTKSNKNTIDIKVNNSDISSASNEHFLKCGESGITGSDNRYKDYLQNFSEFSMYLPPLIK